MLMALKTARDAVNLRADASRHFFLTAAESDSSACHEALLDAA